MGQPVSTLASSGAPSASGPGAGSFSTSGTRVAAIPPYYLPLCEQVKAGDAGAAVSATSDDSKDAQSKILEFGAALRSLPKDPENLNGSYSASTVPGSSDQYLQEILSAVDSADELFQYISNLAALPADEEASGTHGDGCIDARIAAYIKSLQHLYHMTKKEKQRAEQRLLATRTQASSQRKATPPPLPLPTQNCLTMGWEIVVLLLKATRAENPMQYRQALHLLKENLRTLKPTTYADSMYLAPSASASFDALSECLNVLAQPLPDRDRDAEAVLGATTMETLAEVALARGSLATLLHVVQWLFNQTPTATVDLGASLSKLAGLKEQQLYGKCEASGELYCCGQNSYGELGIGDDIERHLLTSVSLSGWDDIRQVVSGNEVLAILTNGGVVLTCGLNKSGQCGHGHFDERVMCLRPVQALRSQKIKFIAASNGCEHIIALTETGLAYSWGYNDRGQLGHENLTTKIHLPKLVESLKDKKIGFAAVSYHHSAVVTESGELYTFGMNDCGQLGLDHTQHMAVPQHVKALEGNEVSMVACGLYHTIVCTASGELFAFGKNDYGQLGLGHSRQVKVPTLVSLPSEMVCFVACGYYHSSVVTTSGHTYSFGRNDYGQLGIGSKIHQNVPTMVALSATTRMTRATCGCYHTVLLSEQGQVLVFGRNNKGQLGNRSSADSLLPVPLKVRPEKNSRRCIDVAAGFYTTSLIFERKRDNDDGDAAVVVDQNCLVSVCGRVDIDRSGEIEGLSNFGSVSTVGIALFEGKWFYEVEVVTCGLIQIGWIDNYFQASSDQGEGVGDHTHSWSYDGNRQRRWNSGSSSYGEKWKAGDVIGCLLDLDAHEMAFYRNGIHLGVAFSDVKCNPLDRRLGLMPGISLERGEIIRVNLGHQPFAHPPTHVGDFDGVFKAILPPATAAFARTLSVEQSELCPPATEGSATVLVKNKVFTIGGSLSGSSGGGSEAEASTQVWAYCQDTHKWERWADFPIAIRNHQAVPVGDDQILVIGGENTTPTSRHMDLYKCSTTRGEDGSLPVWELVQGAVSASSNALPSPRAHHVAATIRARLDSMVIVYGGKSTDNEVLGDVWYLSLEDYSWSRLPNSLSLDPGPRSGCSAAVIGENVYVFGGQDKEEKLRSDLWRYNAFDRVWHLCYDDNITFATEGNSVEDPAAKSEFAPTVPEARSNYSITADFGNVWIFGGASQSGALLRDLWCYSVTSHKWSLVDVAWEEDQEEKSSEGWAGAALMISAGSATALANASNDGGQVSGRVLPHVILFGGTVQAGGVTTSTTQLRELVAIDSTRTFAADPAKSLATTGKSSVILGTLRAKCTAGGTGRTSQQCLPLALDSGVCILSHLDRLAGNDIPGEDIDTIQLSRCSYRTLCVDPNEQTLAALYTLLAKLSSSLQTVFRESSSTSSATVNVVVDVLYPTLVVIRLLKLNLFELARSSIDLTEVGLLPSSILPGGTLFSLREILFKIAEHAPLAAPTGETAWFYRAVKQETATTIYHGFSILFPSLLDRVEVMNKLMRDPMESDPTQKLLVPMLVPCFTSTKMLFQLMDEVQATAGSRSAFDAPEVVAEFASTLLETLWTRTKHILDAMDTEQALTSTLKKLGDLDTTNEFRCLNILIRSGVYWCAHSIARGWPVMLSISVKLVTCLDELLATRDSNSTILVSLVQHTFAGKLLPFVLLSVSSLPSVREAFTSTFAPFWPHLETLLGRVHSTLSTMKPRRRPSSETESLPERESSLCPPDRQSLLTSGTRVRVSTELGRAIGLGTVTSSVLPYEDVVRAIWKTIGACESCRAIKLATLESAYRVGLPSELAKLFGVSSLTVTVLQIVGDLPHDYGKLRDVDAAMLSFAPSTMVLSQHIHVDDVTSASMLLPPAPPVHRHHHARKPSRQEYYSAEPSIAWLRDLHNVLVWLGSHYAASLVIGVSAVDAEADMDPRWMQSPLLRGGLAITTDAEPLQSTRLSDAHDDTRRNDLLLQQIVQGFGAGKKLVDKVKLALDPGTAGAVGGANPKLMAARLKRQDSVEAALEKSGGIDVVDRAVRVAFAVLLKHSNAAYVNGGLTKNGTPSEAVIDAWRSALQLRRWIVREQQKLASERSASELASLDGSLLKERQLTLYATVCGPLIRRGELLLLLAPAPSSTSPISPPTGLKLLPGVSAATNYDLPRASSAMEDAPSEENEEAVRQLKMIMNTKTMDVIEQEDEKMEADIFAFLQYSRKPKTVPEDGVPEDLCERVLAALQSHQHKGQQRLSGLQIFSRLLHVTDSNPSCRRSIIPSLSTAFKRFVHRGDANASVAVEKVHYSDGLEFAGPWLFKNIRDEFFKLLGNLLAVGNDHVAIVRQSIEKGSCGDLTELKALSSQAHEAVLEVVQILEACSVPYQGDDWDSIHTIQFLPLITELSSWRSWKTTLQLNFVDDHCAESPGGGVIPILAAASGQRCPKIICARAITIGTDLQQLKVSGNQGGGGGMAVFHHSLNRGRWYWEISILSQDERSVFIGLASNTDDLNRPMPSQTHVGIHVFRDTTGLVVGSSEEGSPHQVPSLRCPLGGTIGVLLDCVDKTLTFFVGARHAKVVSLETSCHGNVYPAIGLQGAGTELCWNLLAPVPVRISSMTSGFRFSAPVVSGCLIASPIDGKTISLDAKTKGRRLRLSPDGTAVIAGDFSMLSEDDVVETITANQAFETDALFAEVQVLSSGRDGRCQLAFGLVGVDMAIDKDFMKRHAVEVTSTEDALLTGAFGVLFEFATGKITVYPPSGGEPLSRVVLMETATSRRLLIPALSVLCNGSVFRVNFHPRPRPELPLANAVRPASIGDNCHVSSSNDLQVGKVLAMHVLNCDGGEFSGSHAAKNCLVDDASVFSSAKGRNIHLVLRHEIDTPFCLSYLTVRGPGPGYSSPLRHALVFVTSSVPDLQRLQEYDDFTPEEFASLPFPAASLRSDRLEYMPVAYVVLDGSCAQVAKQLAVPVQGRYIVVKLLCASASSCTNIDVGYIGFCGTFDKDNGPAYADHAVTAAVCEACQASSLYGVTYSLKEDDSVKLCASCYDDHRGSLEATFFAHIGLETVDGQGDDGFALCVARKAHVELLTAQVAQAACRRSRSPPGSNTSSGPMPMSMDSSVGGYLSEGGTKSERALMWFDDCELFSCGQNNYGELCLGHCNSTTKLEHVPFFSTKSTRDIAGGNEVLAVLMKDGTVFTCGLNKSGQCGNGTFDERVLAATPVRALQGVAIEMIAAANGCEHMLAVASDGAVYSWGYNDRGQLGLGSTISKSHTPRLIESLREKYVITTAAVSYHHSAVISSAGELLTFGMNDCGQLGLDHLQHQHTPQLVDALSSQVAVKVACGLYHTVVATASGELYAFGKNDYGQLGLGHARNLKVPTLVRVAIGDSDERIVDVSCGYYHTVAITDKGKLLTWGRNDYGQLGIGSKDHKNTPQYVPLPLSSRIRKSSCGCYHTLILLANGRVMVFGRNNKGQLGAGARTLPSADLPLPIPLHSLSNDEVMCVAAGFYSSYILTGRPSQSQDSERAKEDHAQATDLAEQHSSSQALYESLMKEIDRKQHKPLSTEKAALIQMTKRASMRRKFPLLKLHAAAWAMVRALLYQSLGTTGITNSQQLTASNKRCVVSRRLAAFLLDNMRELQNEILELRSDGRWDASSVTLKNACVGLLTQCVTRSQIPHTPVSLHPDRLPLPSLYPHLFRNQLLWVLLSCGAADASLCSVLASNGHVLDEILRGMTASDLSSATICIRLAMLVFPMHSVSSVNAAYRTVLGSTTASTSSCPNILSVLMLVVGHPLVLRPRLCSHELGIERSCSPLCESAKCLKGLAVSEDKNINGLKEDVLERSHIAAAKAAEVVALLRYLTLYPTWKVAVNASITKAFAKTEMIGELLDAVCAYYAGMAGRDAEDTEEPITTVIEPVATEQLNDITTTAQENATREPETTTAGSPEIDDTGIPEGRDDADKEEDDAPSSGVLLDTLIRDKKDLQVWQKAKESLDALASILAAVCLVGGHIETLREGAIAIIEDADHKSRGKAGVLSGIKRDPRGELCASVQLIESSSTSGWQPLQRGGITISNVGIRNLKPVERVPALLHMFNCLDGVICSLSLLVLPPSHDGHAYYELNLPQNNRVQEMLGRRLQLYSQQLQWRATMALSNLLKQMPQLSTELINADTQLLSNIAQTIAAEDPLQNTSALALVQASSSMTTNVVDVLHTRWVSLKQRQMWLETDHVLDDALDCYELETRDDVVRKLGQQNALSWGPDAIQSPRKGSTSSSFFNGKSSGAYQLGGLQRSERDRTEAGTRPGGRTTLPQGAWGVLHPLPPLNENESGGVSSPAAVDAVPFPLTTPVVRVGRAADSCDLIVNDRSVSGRHFHLRRVRRDHEGGGSAGGAEEFFELQDFSKNGTIVNGVRVHGTSVRVTPGSRISLILSRGGLVTYEFQVRPSHGSAGLTTHRMAPPPPILTGPLQTVDSNVALIQGQEYQQPLSAVGPGPGHMEPRSPAEIQNRGCRQQSMESVRSRMPGGQGGLRLITSIAESEVPRALISPNPAVESPRVGGFSSPRSSILQAPGTPAVPSATANLFASLGPAGVLSPASYQQRESAREGGETAMLRAPEPTTPGTSSDGLRIALGRDSFTRESGQHNSLAPTSAGITVMEPPRLKTSHGVNEGRAMAPVSPALDLLARLRGVGLLHTTVEQCEEALHAMHGDEHSAFTILHDQLLTEQTTRREGLRSPTVQRLANLLNVDPVACAEALCRTQQSVPAAIRLLLSPSGAELIRTTAVSAWSWQSSLDPDYINDALVFGTRCNGLMNLQELMEENPSYALAESSAMMSGPPRARPASPSKSNGAGDAAKASMSPLALWVECSNQAVDDRLNQLAPLEMEDEELSICGLLTAVHSRQLLEQIVRLFKNVPDQADNLLAAFGDPVTLRHLILFPSSDATTPAGPVIQAGMAQECSTIQRILNRSSDDAFRCASSSSLQTNMHAVQNLSALCLAIDQRDCWSTATNESAGSDLLAQLVRTLVMYECQALRHDDSGLLHQTTILHNLVVDTLLHSLSRTFVHQGSLLNWEAAVAKSSRRSATETMLYPKGPIRLSCGIECVVVASYERVWSVPSPDPLLQFRHKWRKVSGNVGNKATPDGYVTIWRPVLPNGAKFHAATTATQATWFALGDVLQSGGDYPDAPVLMVRDDASGLVLPPVGFERVDVSGKGLPKNSDNDPDFQRKQVRSVWWPIPPPGYVALGCVAGTKEDPFQPPALSSVRCIREELTHRAESYSCRWRAETRSFGPPTLIKALDQLGGMDPRRNQQTEQNGMSMLEMAADEVCVRTSLWSVDSEFCKAILPVLSVDGEASQGATASTIRLSQEDKTLCSPVSAHHAMRFVDVILDCHQSSLLPMDSALRPELAAALFALVKQVLGETLPGSGPTAVVLVRALIRLIQQGGAWSDKDGLLYCRSKILTLQHEHENGGALLLPSLLQAFVELMLVVDEETRGARVQTLTSYLDQDAKSSTIHLPYRFQFARADAHKEMLVSHSSKMMVTRHFSGEERKFLLEYHADDTAQPGGDASSVEPTASECFSCRFEHTPELVMTLKDELKAEIVYFELTVLEWTSTLSTVFGFGLSPPEFPLEGPVVGMAASGVHSYSFTPVTGKVHSSHAGADHWRWNEQQLAAVAIGDVFGCGLRLDTREVFFTKNGRLLGTAFSSVVNVRHLHPTVSVSGDCKFLLNFGNSCSSISGDNLSKVNFAFRFHTMEYDCLMGGLEWYEPLSQVYGVMKALVDPERDAHGKSGETARGALLPDEFMLSADNFLSDISHDVCLRVESTHPYDLELQEALVSIPLATSIRVKLDAQCETASSHCLQILQGGDGGGSGGPESNGGSGSGSGNGAESEVRAFTGACGGQEVMIDGDCFVWRFPVQSNFQCRVDRVRKGPYLKLESRDTRLSLSRDKGWQTAIGVARFDSGVHIWEVRITFVTASSNIFLGIARRDVRLDSYLGKDNRGWGWIGNRALWHNGSKQRGTYGDKFKTGDVVRLTLDLKRGTLSYALNGKDLGVAFGPGGVGPKLEGTFYPGFALYNQRDSIDLIGGHRLEDGEALPAGGSGVAGLLPGSALGEDAYYSEDDDDALGDSVDDTTIPNFRMELATALSLMGFPMDWCVYALRHCEDDAEQAADFILSNMHVMEALVREEAEAQARRLRHREALAVAAAASAPGGASPTRASEGLSGGGLIPGDAGDHGDSEEFIVSGSEDPSSQSAADGSTPQSIDKWGIAFTAVPEFSVTGRRLLASKYASKLQQLRQSQAVFTADHDNAIVQIVNEICESRAEALLSCDPLRMAPEDFVPTDDHLHRFQCLDGLPLAQLQKRFLILRNFNCRLQNSLAFIDLSVSDDTSLLARASRQLRGIIFQHVKLAWWLNLLKEQQSPAASRPEIEVDRHRAREATPASGAKDSVFAQCFDQLHSLPPSLLRGADRAFKCQFVGEFGDDFGGLYRECLAQISSELQSPVLSVLTPCANALASVGDHRDKFVPNVHLRIDARLVHMAEFLGKLMGIAVRTKTPLDLNLPAVVWKTLVAQRVVRRDVESIHDGCFQVVDAIDHLQTHGITETMYDEIIDAQFTVTSSARRQVEILPGGHNVRVQWDDKHDYARAVEAYRLCEFTPVCRDVLRGLATMLPAPTLALFTWHELATLVCGKPTVDMELLRRRTIYGDGCQANDPHIAYFWDVLNEFTDEQKSSFLRFVWGRSRLPTHAADFTQDFKISGLPKAAGRPDAYLPIAHTCFFSIDLPNYTSRDVTRERLLYAITHCLSIDADNTTVAQRAGQGLNWTAAAVPMPIATGAATTTSTTATASAIAAVTASATSAAVATAAAAVSSVIAGLSAAMTE